MLSLACGHAVLCPACCAQLRAREEPEACPVCRTHLAHIASADDFQLAGDASFVPPQPRLLAIMELLRHAQDGQPDGDDEKLFGADLTPAQRQLITLTAFAEHSREQQLVALQGGALDATCAAMRGAPLCTQMQEIGCLAICGLLASATDDMTTEVRTACERTRARGVALHALHCLASGSDAEAAGVAMEACWKTAQAWRGISHRQAACIAHVASAAVCTVTDEDYEDEQEEEHAQRSALTAMQLLASLAGAPSKRTRDACAPVFVTACASTLLHVMRYGNMAALTVHSVVNLRNALVYKKFARGCATAYAAQCTAALDADALPALLLCALRMSQDNEALGSDAVAKMCAEALLPAVAALCVLSPRALRAALAADLMPVLVAVSVPFEQNVNVGSAICALLAAALTPAASDADQAMEWRAARAEATAAAVAAQVPERVVFAALADAAMDAVAQLARRTSPDGDEHLRTACALVSAAAQALAAYGGLLEHGAPPNTTAVAASAVATCAAAVAEQANALAAMRVQAARDKPDATGCDEACKLQSEAHAAACRAVAALLRVTPAPVCGVEACALVAMAALSPIHDGGASCDVVQASACGLLLQLAAACGGGEALQRLLHATTPPLAAVLTACALQARKPALRREALHALALLLALQLAS